jgi:hypothetical protein
MTRVKLQSNFRIVTAILRLKRYVSEKGSPLAQIEYLYQKSSVKAKVFSPSPEPHEAVEYLGPGIFGTCLQ